MKRPLSLIGFLIAVQVKYGTPLVIDNNSNNDKVEFGNEHPIVPVQPTIDVESFNNNNNNNNGEIFNWSTHRHLLKHRPHPSYLDTHIQPQRPSSTTTFSSNNNNEDRHHHQQQQQHQRKLYHRTTGTFHNLVLLIRFSNHISRPLPTRQSISRLYNSEETVVQRSSEEEDVIPTGSVRQVYLSNSQNQFKIDTTVVDWITVSGTEEYYGNGNHGFSKLKEAIIEILQKLDEGEANVNGLNGEGIKFDFNSFDINDDNALDGLGILHSGYGAEFGGEDCYGTANEDRIWSHKGGLTWSSSGGESNKVNVNRYYVSSALRGKCNSNIVRMGVICHELGHYLGLPDLYDSTFEGAGLGAYDYMSQSWGFDGSGKYPPNLCAWSKLHVGWAKATVIDEDGTYTISASGVDEEGSNNKVYKIQSGFPDGEYLLIENRQPIGYDVKINGKGGIAIYHVDDNVNGQGVRGYPSSSSSNSNNGWPNNGHHYQVALLSADGKYDLEKGVNQGDSGDLWASRSSTTTTGLVLNELKAGSSQYPNTDSYQNGIVTETGIRIYGFSESGHVMTFRVEGLPTPAVVNEEEEEAVSTTTTTSPPTTANPTTANPTTLQPTSRAPTNAPSSTPPTTYQPTPLPSSKPTTLSPTTEVQLCTNLCLIPIPPDECPSDIITAQLPDCTSSSSLSTQGVQIGELCDADGECNSDQFLDNCLFYDIYRRVDCNSTLVVGEEDATVIVVDGSGTPQFEGNDIILPDSNVLTTSHPTLEPTTADTSPPSVDTLTTTLDDTTDNNNNNDCPYYPGWNQGLSHCLKDCHQPSYMQGNPTFEFITLEQCCELHYAGTASCKTQSVLALETSYANTFAKITGQVWNDVNGNDWQDASERGMGDGVYGVLVDLYDCTEYTPDGSGSGSWVKGTRTSLDGSYVFDTIYTPGSYYVQITVPSGYTLSLEQSWLAETEYDSDFNILGRSECIEFGSSSDDGSGNLDLMLDAGLIPNALATTSVQPTSKPTVAAVTSSPPTSQPTTSKPTTAGIAVEAVSQVEEDEPATIQSAAASFSASGMHSKSATTSYSTLDSSVTIEQVTPSFLRGSSSLSSNTNDMVLIYPTSEATIHSQQDMKFIGGEDELLVGPQLSWQDDTLLKFDLSDGLSSSSQQDYRAAKQAVLSLYSLTSSQTGGAVHFASSNGFDWDASSVTWSTAPKAGHVLGSIGETKPNTWIEVDVTGLLLSEDGHVTLRITSEKNNHSWVAKYSSSSSKENYVPVLKVYF